MDPPSSIAIFQYAFLLLLSIPFLYSLYYTSSLLRKRAAGLRLPPGPPPLPLLGNFHLIDNFPHQSFLRLSHKYGPIMQLQLGSVPAVVVSSAAIAMEILQTQDQKFASRPVTTVADCIGYGCSDITFAPYSPRWRFLRKVAILEMLAPKRVEQNKDLRMQEICAMLQSIQESGDEEVDLLSKLSAMVIDLISRMVLNQRFREATGMDASEFRSLLAEVANLAAVFILADHLPAWLSWFDPYGYKRQAKAVQEKLDVVMESIVREHEEAASQKRGKPDFVDTLLQIQNSETEESKFVSRDAIKAMISTMLLGGSEVPLNFIIFAMWDLLHNPLLLKQAQAEVDSVVGDTRMVDESDIRQLTFLRAIVKETLRLHPELLSRECLEDCKVAGYDIPRNTRVYVNSWAMCHDPSFWKNPLAFCPHRFLEESNGIEPYGQNFNFLPFGSGRRSCPGMTLGSTIVHLTLACLLHSFDWSLAGVEKSKQLDTPEATNVLIGTMPLMVTLKPRLSTKHYMKI